MATEPDVLIVGAGLSGLIAARGLQASGTVAQASGLVAVGRRAGGAGARGPRAGGPMPLLNGEVIGGPYNRAHLWDEATG